MTTDVSRLMPAARLHGPAKLPSQGAGDGAGINAKITALEQLDLPSLRRRWRDVHGSDAPARLGSEFLRRAMAFHLQEQVFGGLSRHARLRLKALERRPPGETGVAGNVAAPASVKAGTRFLRQWQGETHEVQASQNGQFVYRGNIYRSLSVIARKITATHQSGPRFFGLKDTGNKIKATRGNDG